MNNKLVKMVVRLNSRFNKLRLDYMNDRGNYFTFYKHYKNKLYTLKIQEYQSGSIHATLDRSIFKPHQDGETPTVLSSKVFLDEDITTSLDTLDFAYRVEEFIK